MLSMKRRIASVVSAPSGGGANGPFFDSMSLLNRSSRFENSSKSSEASRVGWGPRKTTLFRGGEARASPKRQGAGTLARARRFGREERRKGAHETPADDDDAGQHAERESLRCRRDARVPKQLEVRPLHEPDAAEADGKRIEEITDGNESDVVNERRFGEPERVPC